MGRKVMAVATSSSGGRIIAISTARLGLGFASYNPTPNPFTSAAKPINDWRANRCSRWRRHKLNEMWIGRSSAQCAFQPPELNRGYQALCVEIRRETRGPGAAALHWMHRQGRADSGDKTNIIPSRRAAVIAHSGSGSAIASSRGQAARLEIPSKYPIHFAAEQIVFGKRVWITNPAVLA